MAYFTVEVKPLIPASTQDTAVFTAGDLLFDWVGFEIPRGGAKLVGVTALVRPKGDAGPTPNNFDFDLIFGKVGTTLGTANAVAFVGAPTNDIIGSVNIAQSNFIGPSSAVSTSCTSVTSVSDLSIVISPDDTALNTGTNVGYDKFYVAGISNNSSIDFRTINVINDADINSTTPTAIVMAGSSMNVRDHFLAGDVLHAADDILLGTVDSIDANDTGPINLTAATSGAGDSTTVTNGDKIYNINPIKLLLHFEK